MRAASILLSTLLLAVLATAPAAQSRGGQTFARYTKPLRSATLDLATGTVTRSPAVRERAAATVTDFANVDLGGFVGVASGGGFCEWFDAGVKGTGMGATAGVANDSDLMNSIVFAYCSTALGPGSGGPGGAVKLGFYEGYLLGGGAPTTTVAAFTLTGLPANTATLTFPSFRCHFIRVVFPTVVCFADGPIGYSWKFLDLQPGSPLAATFPFLACVRSCSSLGQPDGQGMQNELDAYCPPGFFRSTFTFGTASGTFTSISMAIEEIVDTTATALSVNSASFPNPDFLAAPPVVLGEPWSPTLTLGIGRSKGGSWFCFFGADLVAPPEGIVIPRAVGGLDFGPSKAGRMLVCAIDAEGFACIGAHTGVANSISVASCGGGAIPKQIGLVCNDWCAQAVVFGPVSGAGNARLSSGVTGTIGTK